MRASVYQQMGTNKAKKEMEDRAVIAQNILANGYHCIERAGEGVYALLDGLGGIQGGAFASTFIARALCDISIRLGTEEIKSVIKQAHMNLIGHSNAATTLSGMMINQSQTIMFHIGNCRIYGLVSGYLQQLTTDQTLHAALLRQGFTEAEIPESANSGMLSCLGSKEEYISGLAVDDVTKQFEKYKRILLTSDGIHDYVEEEALESMMNGEITKEGLESIMQIAIENGSQDDLSIMVLEK